MAYNHYAAGWVVAGSTPFTWVKQVASSYGGTRNPLVIHWPKGIKAKETKIAHSGASGGRRADDPEGGSLPELKLVNGTEQIKPIVVPTVSTSQAEAPSDIFFRIPGPIERCSIRRLRDKTLGES
jgi:hypothetical protein